ncbi:MAG: RIP metalloprotease RseP [Alphaproteobacteria bacterium]
MNPIPSTHDWLTRLAEMAQSYPGGEMAFTIALFVIVLSILVFVHELGHYLAARSVGIQVHAFSIGFGREILGWTDRAGTRWKVGWIPMGGYVQMRGQEDLKPIVGGDGDSRSFANKTIVQRAWVIVAGPLANLLLGFVLLVAVMLTGEHKLKAEVGDVLPNMPAAGVLEKGDFVTALDGVAVAEWDDMQTYISEHAGQTIQVQVVRGGVGQVVTLTPELKEFTDLLGDVHKVGRVGVAPSYSTFVVEHPPIQAVARSAERTWELTKLTVLSLYKLMIGAVASDNLAGPLGIANMTGQAASSGTFALMMFLVVITINLFVVNLFPLPVLDGGHLVFLAVEKLRGRPLGAMAQEWAMRVGLALIVMLALYSTLNDTKRLGLFGKAEPVPAEQVGNAPAQE